MVHETFSAHVLPSTTGPGARYGEEHAQLASTLVHLAAACETLGEVAEQLHALQRALAIQEEMYPRCGARIQRGVLAPEETGVCCVSQVGCHKF